jgi:hypothetical protein
VQNEYICPFVHYVDYVGQKCFFCSSFQVVFPFVAKWRLAVCHRTNGERSISGCLDSRITQTNLCRANPYECHGDPGCPPPSPPGRHVQCRVPKTRCSRDQRRRSGSDRRRAVHP